MRWTVSGELAAGSTPPAPVPQHTQHYQTPREFSKARQKWGRPLASLTVREGGGKDSQQRLSVVSSAARQISSDLEERLISYSILFEQGSMIRATN